jgi:hypothetical protein
MKFISHFQNFLRDHVNLNRTRLDQLDGHVEAIENYLCAHDTWSALVVQTIPQGSWAHQTIIKPLPSREFDADFLLEITPQRDWEPKDYINRLKAAMLDSKRYSDRTSSKNRCVRVQYANDCHIDMVPFIRGDSEAGAGQIVVRIENQFELTNPEAFTAWFDEQNQISGGHLRRVIRLAKYLRDIKGTFTAKSVILTTLLASQIEPEDIDCDDFKDTPTALVCVMNRLAQYLAGYPSGPPTVPDPSSPGQDFNHRWPSDISVYQNFREKIAYYAEKMAAAYEESDRDTSLQLWQDIFGEDFGKVTTAKMMENNGGRAIEERAPSEQFITEFGIEMPKSLTHRVIVQCLVLKKSGFRHGDLKRLGHVDVNRCLLFRVQSCSVPKPYTIYWKVRNHGLAAAREEDLRGEITITEEKHESTLYPGQHIVECYIVREDRVWAQQQYPVRIRGRRSNI